MFVFLVLLLVALTLAHSFIVYSTTFIEPGGWIVIFDDSGTPSHSQMCTLAIHSSNFGAPLPSFMFGGGNGCESDFSINILLTTINIVFYVLFYTFMKNKLRENWFFRTVVRRVVVLFIIAVMFSFIFSSIYETTVEEVFMI